jgi:hypothetical protein
MPEPKLYPWSTVIGTACNQKSGKRLRPIPSAGFQVKMAGFKVITEGAGFT